MCTRSEKEAEVQCTGDGARWRHILLENGGRSASRLDSSACVEGGGGEGAGGLGGWGDGGGGCVIQQNTVTQMSCRAAQWGGGSDVSVGGDS